MGRGKLRKESKIATDLCGKGEGGRISALPDEVLAAILSRLNVAEAARTCVLSKRWRYLWTHVTCLNFDDLDSVSVFPALKKGKQLYEAEWKPSDDLFLRGKKKSRKPRIPYWNHIILGRKAGTWHNWVDKIILESHQGSTLEGFRISGSCVSLVNSCVFPDAFDRWIESAIMQKRVKRLEIDLKSPCGDHLNQFDCDHLHEFNQPFLFPNLPILKTPLGVSYINNSLTHLSLKCVHITEEFEHFVTNCQLLQHLCISGYKGLETLKVESLGLKFLQISECGLKKLEIYAPNLASFIYDNGPTRRAFYNREIVLKHAHAPSIVNLSLAGNAVWITDAFLSTKRYFHQLETLNLGINFPLNWGERDISFLDFPELTRLKDLSLSVVATIQQSLLGLTSLIEQSPFLQRLTLKIEWNDNKLGLSPPKMGAVTCNRPHQCLKVVKISGFIGSTLDTQFALRFIENTTVLEKFIIEQANEKLGDTGKQALQELRTKLPPGAELIII